jgi:hypothetical protein
MSSFSARRRRANVPEITIPPRVHDLQGRPDIKVDQMTTYRYPPQCGRVTRPRVAGII